MSGKHHKTTTPWWRRLGRRPPPEKPRRWLTEMVEGATELAHWVTPEAFEQGLRERTGFYEVLCGRRIAVASMTAPSQHSCWNCQQARAC